MPSGGSSPKGKRDSAEQVGAKTKAKEKEKSASPKWIKDAAVAVAGKLHSSSQVSTKDSPRHSGRRSPRAVIGAPSIGAGASPSSSSTPSRGAKKAELIASLALEEFIASGLLQDDPHMLLEVQHSEPIASVVEQLHRRRLSTCVVTQEFFDCMDFASYLLEVITGGVGVSSPPELRQAAQDWENMKKKLRKIATEPVRKALRSRSRNSIGTGCMSTTASNATAASSSTPSAVNASFGKFDTEQSLQRLIPLLRAQRPIPVFRDGELRRTVTPGDVLELCMSVKEETKALLERTPLQEVLAKSPSALSKLQISEDQTLVEVIFQMREASVYVVPILASHAHSDNMGATATIGSSASTNGGKTPEDTSELGNLVGQFDIAALRALYMKRQDDGDDSESGQWWWEDKSITANVLLETCMGFSAVSPGASGDHVPYAAVLSSEPLAKAISRAVATSYQSVVVYHVDGARTDAKSPEGLASTLGLVTAMLEAGLFSKLVFDPTKQRRQRDLCRKPTLTAQDVQVALGSSSASDEANGPRRTKVTFHSVIELEGIIVPTCPEHGLHFMRFSKEDDPKNVMDFHALRDWVSEAKALGAISQCLACQRSHGRIVHRAEPQAAEVVHGVSDGPTKTNTGGFVGAMESLSAGLQDKAGFGRGSPKAPAASTACTSQRSPRGSPRSALKAGTPGAGGSSTVGCTKKVPRSSQSSSTGKSSATPSAVDKKSSNDKLSEPSRTGGAAASDGVESAASRGSIFGLCCVTACQCSGSKDTIAISSGSYSRVNSNGSDSDAKSNHPSERAGGHASERGKHRSKKHA